MTEISIIIPAHNEDEHLATLFNRINTTLTGAGITYEIILVDDGSTDTTDKVVKELALQFPITLITKKKRTGKANAIILGAQKVKYDLTAILDADLQYPPEALPKLMAEISSGADVVVAQRTKQHPVFTRRISAEIYKQVFGKWLHNLNYDVHSGLKVFKTEVIQRLPLKPSAWGFDIEFLVKAKQASYKISSIKVEFAARKANRDRKPNYNIFNKTWQMIFSALFHKYAPPSIIPFTEKVSLSSGRGFDYNGKRFVTHNTLNPHKTALYRLNSWHIFIILTGTVLLVSALVYNWHTSIIIIVAALTVLYFADLLFNLFLILRSVTKGPDLTVSDEELAEAQEYNWPHYSIFCPLYKEHEVIPQFVTAISKLDYPKDKLQVLLLLEEDDKVTIEKAEAMNLPPYFEIVVVPDSLPKTKPKACNYGLLKATGEYVVIYDAEDVPDPLQLKKAVLGFKKSSSKVICIQAKLNFYNPHQNLLTRLFTAEYSLWFDLVLTGIQSINAPIPLGGTSNHFRVADLHKLMGWDAFNVTEDCDLGMRLVKRGYKTAILDSTTLEEANSDLLNWFWQRSRWIKGYMQSYLVHMRDFQEFLYDWREPHGITFQLIVGGKVLSMLINPFMWMVVVIYFTLRPIVGDFIDTFFPAPIFYMAIFSLVFGNFLYLYYYMVGCARRGHEDLIKYVFFVPLYWLAMSLAAYMAVYKLITAPHHWSKTKHGLHLNNVKALAQSKEKIGGDLDDKFITARPAIRKLNLTEG